jgi:hypothetical protein
MTAAPHHPRPWPSTLPRLPPAPTAAPRLQRPRSNGRQRSRHPQAARLGQPAHRVGPPALAAPSGGTQPGWLARSAATAVKPACGLARRPPGISWAGGGSGRIHLWLELPKGASWVPTLSSIYRGRERPPSAMVLLIRARRRGRELTPRDGCTRIPDYGRATARRSRGFPRRRTAPRVVRRAAWRPWRHSSERGAPANRRSGRRSGRAAVATRATIIPDLPLRPYPCRSPASTDFWHPTG